MSKYSLIFILSLILLLFLLFIRSFFCFFAFFLSIFFFKRLYMLKYSLINTSSGPHKFTSSNVMDKHGCLGLPVTTSTPKFTLTSRLMICTCFLLCLFFTLYILLWFQFLVRGILSIPDGSNVRLLSCRYSLFFRFLTFLNANPIKL